MAEFERLHVGNSEIQEKQAVAFDFAQTATVGLAATGVLTGLMVNQTTTASGSVVIGAGAGVVGSTVGAGASEPVNPGDVTFDVFTLNPVGGLPRNDIIVWDSTTRAFAVVVGTPNATPSDPTVANTKLPLGRLRHAASATTIPLAKIDDLRVFTGLLNWVGVTKRSYILSSATGSLANIGAIGTISLPSIPVASRVLITAAGMIGYAAAATQAFGLNITASAGTMTDPQSNQQVLCPDLGQWYLYARAAYLDLPANTASVITVTLSSIGANGYWKGQVRGQVLLPGEY